MDEENNKEIAQEEKTEVISTDQKNNTKILMFLPVVLVLLIAGYFIYKMNKNNSGFVGTPASNPSQTDSSNSQSPTGPVKEFTVDGSNYQFSPTTLTVNKGDNVKIIFKDDDGMHNLAIEGYNVTTSTIKAGSDSSVSFVADKTGNFTYYCSVGNHREKGMVGTLTVQ
jgi:plastocyanin